MTSWGTLFYGFIAGVCGTAAVVFMLIGARRRRDDLLALTFGLFALVSAVATVATIDLHSSTTIDGYVDAFRVFGFASYLYSIALVGLVAVWTQAVSRRTLIVWGVATLVVGVAQVSLTDGLLAGPIEELRTVYLFGEEFTVHVAPRSSWRWLLDVWLVATIGLMATALIRGFRSGAQDTAAVMSAALAANLFFAIWDSAVDAGSVGTPYLAPVGSLAVMLGGAAYLAERAVRTEHRLEQQTARLEEIVVDRTEALRESNDRLAGELVSQQQAARSLALLTSEFETSSDVVHSRSMPVDSLQRLLDLLATIVPADRVELRLDNTPVGAEADMLFVRAPAAALPGDGDDNAADLVTPIRIKGRTVGSLSAWLGDAEGVHTVESKYLRLTGEHLSAMFDRIELIREISDSAVAVERQRIARDLHDSVTQRMYSVSFLADALVHFADDDPAQIAGTSKRIRELVLSSLVELRSLLFELRPETLSGTTLGQLLTQLGEQASATSELTVNVETELTSPLPVDVKVGLYRIGQEAVSNACRHSGGSRVDVALRDVDGVVSLRISDDGDGFDPSHAAYGHGVANVRDRANSIDAELDVGRAPGGGAAVEVRWIRPIGTRTAELERQA